MRGASALQQVIDAFPGGRVRTFVVWEPVIYTDLGPPTSSVLSLVRDPRARQYWDPGKTLSRDIVRSVNLDPSRYGFDAPLDRTFVVWDVVAVFAPGIVWGEYLPVPAYYDGPVAYRMEATQAAIEIALGGAS